jgi:putative flippase GtrA
LCSDRAEALVKQVGLAEELSRLARFSAVGVIATAVHIGVAMVAVAAADVNPTVGAMIGFLSAFIVSYVGHFRFTFAASGRYRDYLLKFAVTSLASFLLSTTAVWLTTTVLGVDYRLALFALAIIVPVCNYQVNRFWVFLQPGGGSSHPLEIVTPE